MRNSLCYAMSNQHACTTSLTTNSSHVSNMLPSGDESQHSDIKSVCPLMLLSAGITCSNLLSQSERNISKKKIVSSSSFLRLLPTGDHLMAYNRVSCVSVSLVWDDTSSGWHVSGCWLMRFPSSPRPSKNWAVSAATLHTHTHIAQISYHTIVQKHCILCKTTQ